MVQVRHYYNPCY